MFKNKKELDIEFFKTDNSTLHSSKIHFFGEQPKQGSRLIDAFRTIGMCLTKLTFAVFTVQFLMLLAELATSLMGYDTGHESIEHIEREWGFFIVGPLLQALLIYTAGFALSRKVKQLINKYYKKKEKTAEDHE
ncbi:MAG TPA: hypothetical protein VM577_03475 [Anaerovoracaceae bacterium]|nr:hypothetical protein [Anaerovoracaceae bacterium]